MKKTKILTKLLAFALVLCMAVPMLASCGSNDTVMSMSIDGKTYTLSEEEFSLLLTIKKLEYCCNLGITTGTDTAAIWSTTTEEGGTETIEMFYKNLIVDQAKAILIEKYLFEKYNLSISDETLKENKDAKKEAVANGAGSYKQYYGYTADQYYDIYMQMVARSEVVIDFLCGENGEQRVTEDDLLTYYTENYVGYQFIMLDMNNKVKLDEEGNRVVKTTEQTVEGDEHNEEEHTHEVEQEAFETEKLTDEEKSEKQNLPATILAELEAGTATFEELVQKYSDDYHSVNFPEGIFVLKEGIFLYDAVDKAAKELEVGEYTTEAISIDSDAYKYIVKRVDLKEKAYEDETYADFFESYEETVKYGKYEDFIKTYFDDVVVDEAVAGRHTVADAYLSEYADLYYQYRQYGLIS